MTRHRRHWRRSHGGERAGANGNEALIWIGVSRSSQWKTRSWRTALTAKPALCSACTQEETLPDGNEAFHQPFVPAHECLGLRACRMYQHRSCWEFRRAVAGNKYGAMLSQLCGTSPHLSGRFPAFALFFKCCLKRFSHGRVFLLSPQNKQTKKR